MLFWTSSWFFPYFYYPNWYLWLLYREKFRFFPNLDMIVILPLFLLPKLILLITIQRKVGNLVDFFQIWTWSSFLPYFYYQNWYFWLLYREKFFDFFFLHIFNFFLFIFFFTQPNSRARDNVFARRLTFCTEARTPALGASRLVALGKI